MPEKNATNELEKELAYCRELEKFIESDQTLSLIPAVKEKLNLFKETIEYTQENYTLSKDSDARTGHKSADSSFFGYKTHLAMTEERVITAAVVTSGEKGDGPELPKLLEMSQNNGIVAKMNPSIAQGFRKDEDRFDYNKDAAMFVCPAGHLAIRKARQGKKNIGEIQMDTYYLKYMGK